MFVGADDPVRPQKSPDFTVIRGEFAASQWGDVLNRTLRNTGRLTENPTNPLGKCTVKGRINSFGGCCICGSFF